MTNLDRSWSSTEDQERSKKFTSQKPPALLAVHNQTKNSANSADTTTHTALVSTEDRALNSLTTPESPALLALHKPNQTHLASSGLLATHNDLWSTEDRALETFTTPKPPALLALYKPNPTHLALSCPPSYFCVFPLLSGLLSCSSLHRQP